MEFRHPYLVAMQDQNPKMFRALRAAGDLEKFLTLKANEAHRLYLELTREAPRGPDGHLTMQVEREAEERVKGMMFEFPDDMLTNWQEEQQALLDPHAQ